MNTDHRGILALCVALLAASCGPTEAGSRGGGVPILSAGPVPVLEIGTVEGEAEYLFERIVGILPLSSGALAVADGGSNTLSIYSPERRFLRSWGGSGGGPAEFRRLSGIHPHGPDSLLALDGTTRRISVFDTVGSLGRTLEGSGISGDETFALDDWLYGPNWIRGALRAERRATVRDVLARLQGPDVPPGYRRVRVEAGTAGSPVRIWVRASGRSARADGPGEEEDGGAGNDGRIRWIVLDGRGTPESVVALPARFEALHSAGSRVFGRWTGELGVQSVRVYHLEETGQLTTPPAWVLSPGNPTPGTMSDESPPPPAASETETEDAGSRDGTSNGPPGPLESDAETTVPEEMRAAMLGLARSQEIHYAGAGTYTAAVDSLDLDAPDGIWIDVVTADDRGWVAALVSPGSHRVCGLGYGAATPPGWRAGSIACALPIP